jgi:hypothetical protein
MLIPKKVAAWAASCKDSEKAPKEMAMTDVKTENNQLAVSVSTASLPATIAPHVSLMNQARLALGQDYQLIDAGDYLAVLHPQYGAAAVVASDNPLEAEKAASQLTSVLRNAKLSVKALPFGVSETSVRPPVIIRSGPQMATDIAVTMARASGQNTEIGEKEMVVVVSLLKHARKVVRQRAPTISPMILTVIETAVRKIIGDTPIMAGGSSVEIEEIAAPEFLLPAILVAAMQTWAIPVAGRKGKGGFTVDLSADSSAVLMYRVSGIETSSPLLLFLPIINIIRRQKRAGEFILDDCIERFGNFMTTNNLNPDFLRDMSVNIALRDNGE